jgi:hypothetical protein
LGLFEKLGLFGFASICSQSVLFLHNPFSTLNLALTLHRWQIGFVLNKRGLICRTLSTLVEPVINHGLFPLAGRTRVDA